MQKLQLPDVTLLGIDCINLERLLKAFKICEYYCDFGSKKLLTDLSENYTTDSGIEIFKIDRLKSVEEYSAFVIKRLNDFVTTDFVLVIQYDGYILNPGAWTEEFLEYDYIGAPWFYTDESNVGNGGFSLRSKKLLRLLQEDDHIRHFAPEDHHICRTYGKYLREKGIRFAPEKLASKFSIEGYLHRPELKKKYGSKWNGQFGFHGFQKTDIRSWRDITGELGL